MATIFDKIISGEIKSWIIWQDDDYLAFLTPFPNTPGASVVIPKVNPGEYIFELDDAMIAGLMSAAKKVAGRLEVGLGVRRVAVVFEGEAVPHVHVKLYPMHEFAADRSSFPRAQMFFPAYPGYIQTSDGPQADETELDRIQKLITEVQS